MTTTLLIEIQAQKLILYIKGKYYGFGYNYCVILVDYCALRYADYFIKPGQKDLVMEGINHSPGIGFCAGYRLQ